MPLARAAPSDFSRGACSRSSRPHAPGVVKDTPPPVTVSRVFFAGEDDALGGTGGSGAPGPSANHRPPGPRRRGGHRNMAGPPTVGARKGGVRGRGAPAVMDEVW